MAFPRTALQGKQTHALGSSLLNTVTLYQLSLLTRFAAFASQSSSRGLHILIR